MVISPLIYLINIPISKTIILYVDINHRTSEQCCSQLRWAESCGDQRVMVIQGVDVCLKMWDLIRKSWENEDWAVNLPICWVFEAGLLWWNDEIFFLILICWVYVMVKLSLKSTGESSLSLLKWPFEVYRQFSDTHTHPHTLDPHVPWWSGYITQWNDWLVVFVSWQDVKVDWHHHPVSKIAAK